MKAVLPALTGKGYESLAIQEGGAASREFLRVTYGQVTDAERRRVRRDLEEYCGLDTLGHGSDRGPTCPRHELAHASPDEILRRTPPEIALVGHSGALAICSSIHQSISSR